MKTKHNKNGTVSITCMSKDIYNFINMVLCGLQGSEIYGHVSERWYIAGEIDINFSKAEKEALDNIKWQI